ncbi:MAG: AMP-binding protein [Dehalococcoidales bacterium]|nr:AMP-binding protein [Dehalococcoidales bacterium]
MRTIRDIIDRQAERQPDNLFLIAPEAGLELTYRQLREYSQSLGKHLLKMGLGKGDKVSYLLHNGYQTARLFLGVMYSGLVVSPLNLLAQMSHLEYVLAHSDTRIVFTTEDEREKLESILQKMPRPPLLFVIDIDGEAVFPAEDLSGINLPKVDEDDPALLLYTSGTTGLPKGVVLTQKNVVAGGEYTALAHCLTEHDRALCSLPLYHINGQIVTTVAPVVSGGSVVMPYRFHTSNFWELISQYRCTWFSVVPTIMSYLLDATDPYADGKNPGLERVRFGRSASAPLPPQLQKDFELKFRVPIIQTMGLTETAAPVFSNPLDPEKGKYGSPGVPVGNEARVINLQDGSELPPGQIGEIVVRGDNVMNEYYKAPGITASALVNGWLHTGDLGYRDEDGFFFITGRLKELIIKGGENIAPAEIDAVLYQHPCVLEAATVGVDDDRYGQEIEAFIVLKPGKQATEKEILDLCLQELGRFKTPRRISFVESLPKGPSGKIQRLKLLEK